ncbi:DUF4410 domain-containing protein [Futiania mangrovi]|uniref:DUF4410 domain-containing protein n=1 Tax=Futiania mangrovi TaxID=2959716 RepID=A0A9J6PLP9_9PROT|nr:DUF4410 domain-containing protein [Futiania mangrovii]MCP1336970.1 DUF4410 domain-containing protein [Futiania mangrovii]
MLTMRAMRGLPAVLVMLAGLVLAGCTTTTVTPEYVSKPQEPATGVAIGELTADNELWALYLPYLRAGLVAELRESNAFAQVYDPAPETLPAQTVLLTGRLTEVDRGNRAARWIIGFGAGRAKARGAFEIGGTDGTSLAKFESWKAYSGGAGIGGADFLDMEDLVQELGKETAGSVVRWSKGQPLEPPRED